MQTISPSLTSDERQTFSACEKIISAGLRGAEDVWLAFIEIETKQLWREGYKDFKHYCREKWAVGTRRFQQIAKATETVKVLSANNCSHPKNEAQVRPLHALDTAEQKVEAWTKAQEKAASEGQPVTAKHVEEAVEEIKPKTLDNQFANAMGFETVEDLTHPRMAKEDAVNLAKGKITEAIDFTHALMTQAYSESEKTWILNHIEAALRHAKHDLEKHRKLTLSPA